MPQTQAEPPQAEQPRTQQIETYKTGFDFSPFIYSDILGNVTFNKLFKDTYPWSKLYILKK